MTELPLSLHSWRAGGKFLGVKGIGVFYRTCDENRDDLPWLVCFHGFPTSSWDWHRLLPLLQGRWRILTFDFPGYGLSDKPSGHDYSLLGQQEVAQTLLRHCGIEAFDLLAHDMGNSVACELLYRRENDEFPFSLNSLVLLNGGVYMDMHRPLFTQRLLRTPVLGQITARLTGWRMFRLQYPRVYAHPEQFDLLHYQEQWALMLHNQGRRALAGIASYMRERVRMGERWTGPLHRLELPLSLIWGQQDPVAVAAIARRIKTNNPAAVLYPLEDVGHYPQLEAPRRVAEKLIEHQQAIINVA